MNVAIWWVAMMFHYTMTGDTLMAPKLIPLVIGVFFWALIIDGVKLWRLFR
jgi:hypothetical protein